MREKIQRAMGVSARSSGEEDDGIAPPRISTPPRPKGRGQHALEAMLDARAVDDFLQAEDPLDYLRASSGQPRPSLETLDEIGEEDPDVPAPAESGVQLRPTSGIRRRVG